MEYQNSELSCRENVLFSKSVRINQAIMKKRRAEREEWAPAFSKLGVTLEQMLKMSETEYQNNKDYLISEGFTAGPIPPVNEALMENVIKRNILRKKKLREEVQNQRIFDQQAPPPPQNPVQVPRPERAQLLDEQNAEFDEAIKKQKEIEEQEELEKFLQKEELMKKREKILVQAAELPPEPENGVTIAVVLPSRKRNTRKFANDTIGQVVINWIAADVELIGEGDPIHFEIRQPTGQLLEADKTLEEQQIQGRVILNVLAPNPK